MTKPDDKDNDDNRKADAVTATEETTIAQSGDDAQTSGGNSEADGTEAHEESVDTASEQDVDRGEGKRGKAARDDGADDGDGDQDRSRSAWARNAWTWVSAALLIALIAGAVFGYSKYSSAADDLATMQKAQRDREAVINVAKDYAMKSLTYTFENPDAFFKAVEDGVSPILKDKYVNAQEVLKAIMQQAQVTSSGEILATDAVAQPGDVYQVTVTASQSVRNLQNPEPRVTNIVLQITVNKLGDKWQVSDIGPRAGSRGPSIGLNSPPSPQAPSPSPAPPGR